MLPGRWVQAARSWAEKSTAPVCVKSLWSWALGPQSTSRCESPVLTVGPDDAGVSPSMGGVHLFGKRIVAWGPIRSAQVRLGDGLRRRRPKGHSGRRPPS